MASQLATDATLDKEAVQGLAERVRGAVLAERRPTPATDIVVWHHGGAMSRVGETETAYAGRDAPFLVTAEVNWSDPSQSDAAIAYGREVWDPMAQHSTGGLYLNFPVLRGGEGGARQGRLRGQLRAARCIEGEVRPDEPLPHEHEHHARELSEAHCPGAQ